MFFEDALSWHTLDALETAFEDGSSLWGNKQIGGKDVDMFSYFYSCPRGKCDRPQNLIEQVVGELNAAST